MKSYLRRRTAAAPNAGIRSSPPMGSGTAAAVSNRTAGRIVRQRSCAVAIDEIEAILGAKRWRRVEACPVLTTVLLNAPRHTEADKVILAAVGAGIRIGKRKPACHRFLPADIALCERDSVDEKRSVNLADARVVGHFEIRFL